MRLPSSKLVAGLAAVALLGAGCGGNAPAEVGSLPVPTGPALPGDYSGSGPGTLISAIAPPNFAIRLRDAASLAARISYRSAAGVEVTGAVFVPRGDPPPDGWPVVAFGHSSTGIRPDCAPSLSPTLLGAQDTVAGLVTSGFVVTVPDYQGLGNELAPHPYLDAKTAGLNLIDSVLAARKLIRNVSDRWAAVGAEQGGQAAWAANEQAREFGGGLRLLGSVSVAPFTDLEALADAAAAGSLTKEQKLLLQSYLAALTSRHQDFDLDAYRRGTVQQKWDVLSACRGAEARERLAVADQITADELRPAGPAAVATLRGFLQEDSLPQRAATAPMWVVYGSQDPGIPQAWTEKALDEACGQGDTIQYQSLGNEPPRDIDVERVVKWIRARIKGETAVDDCSQAAESTTTESTTTESSTTESPTDESEPVPEEEAPQEEESS